ncbi:hypothetical protein ACTD5D_15950 [Nocardia takedensis]|uniref:hypothetical protein n=1 Tax=Nocardia takedensis TaxID=259390 RepID=UPI003F768FB3
MSAAIRTMTSVAMPAVTAASMPLLWYLPPHSNPPESPPVIFTALRKSPSILRNAAEAVVLARL